jgi:hypothetical protein
MDEIDADQSFGHETENMISLGISKRFKGQAR